MDLLNPFYVSIKILLLLTATFYVGYRYGAARKLMNEDK